LAAENSGSQDDANSIRDDEAGCHQGFPEQPVPVETAYLLDRIKALIKKHPRWRSREPFRSALARNYKKLAAEGTRGVLEMSAAVHSGMTTDEYDAAVLAWLDRARYVRLDRLYSQATLLPMMELLTFLRESGFRIFIVTRGDAAFLRPWAFRIYGITPDHVIGSSIRTSYVVRKGVPLLVRKDAFDLLEDGPSRPQALFRAIGCRPIAAFGSSDADISMLQWVSGGNVRHLVLLVHHTNGGNEFAYDRRALYGRLDKGLITARKSGWVIADMTKDFNRFFQKIAN
jgi:hypothetical protein